MSKLVKQLTVRPGERVSRMRHFHFREDLAEDPLAYGTKYSMSAAVRCGMVVFGEGSLETARRKMVRSIVEEIFGEFRCPIIEIGRAIAEGNYEEAASILDAMEKEMFEL